MLEESEEAVREKSVVCSECGKLFQRDDVIQLQGRYACAACKPLVTQRLKEGILELPLATQGKLYSPKQIGVAAFLGTPISACWFIAYNYRKLGQSHLSTQSLRFGILGTFIIIAISYALPERFPNMLLPLIYSYGIYYIIKHRLGEIVRVHILAGGRVGSWWMVLGMSLLFVLILFGLMTGVLMLVPEDFLVELEG